MHPSDPPTAPSAPNEPGTPAVQPLIGLTIVEFEGLGPAPLAARMLAQHGAEVTTVVRPAAPSTAARLGGDPSALREGKRVLELDLKTPRGVAHALSLVARADALIEGHRPGVMERLGLGPAVCHALNPRLVYGRMTGWGQTGPLAHAAGHDLNYVALTGLLALSARAGDRPIVPPTVLGDGVGALGLAFGIVCGVLRARSGQAGSVVDAAIVDIASTAGGLAHWLHAGGALGRGAADAPASVFHDSPFYDVYACADGRFVALGAIEPAFYAVLLERLGLDDVDRAAQYDRERWPALKARLATLFATRTRDAWCTLLEGSDACFAPVLTLDEAAAHPHHAVRGTFESVGAGVRPAAAPRFSEPAAAPGAAGA